MLADLLARTIVSPRELADTVSLLRHNTAEEHTDDKLYALNEAAKTVGVEIRRENEQENRER